MLHTCEELLELAFLASMASKLILSFYGLFSSVEFVTYLDTFHEKLKHPISPFKIAGLFWVGPVWL